MKCINCGYHLKKGETVCPYCETPVEDMLSPQAAPAGKEPVPPPALRLEEDEDRRRAAEYARKADEAAARRKWGAEYDRRRQASERDSARRMKRNLFLGLLALAVIYMVAVSVIYNNEHQEKRASQTAASSRAYAMSVKETIKLDETKKMKGLKITVQKVQRLSSYEGIDPGDGMEYVAVTLSLINESGGSLYYSVNDFLAVNAEGEAAHALWNTGRLMGGQMDIGGWNTGMLVFLEPEGTALVLRYLPGPTDDMLEFSLYS